MGDCATFDVTVAEAGEYTFDFRYINGSNLNGGIRPMAIGVNESVQATPDFARGVNSEGEPNSWTDWQIETVTLTLDAGTSTISLTNTVTNGPNSDSVTITASTRRLTPMCRASP